MKDFNQTQIKIFKALSIYRDINMAIAGNSHKTVRQEILSALLDRKTTKAESGITAIMTELYKISEVKADCEAVKMDKLRTWLKQF